MCTSCSQAPSRLAAGKHTYVDWTSCSTPSPLPLQTPASSAFFFLARGRLVWHSLERISGAHGAERISGAHGAECAVDASLALPVHSAYGARAHTQARHSVFVFVALSSSSAVFVFMFFFFCVRFSAVRHVRGAQHGVLHHDRASILLAPSLSFIWKTLVFIERCVGEWCLTSQHGVLHHDRASCFRVAGAGAGADARPSVQTTPLPCASARVLPPCGSFRSREGGHAISRKTVLLQAFSSDGWGVSLDGRMGADRG